MRRPDWFPQVRPTGSPRFPNSSWFPQILNWSIFRNFQNKYFHLFEFRLSICQHLVFNFWILEFPNSSSFEISDVNFVSETRFEYLISEFSISYIPRLKASELLILPFRISGSRVSEVRLSMFRFSYFSKIECWNTGFQNLHFPMFEFLAL